MREQIVHADGDLVLKSGGMLDIGGANKWREAASP